jgi:hypothetical protein
MFCNFIIFFNLSTQEVKENSGYQKCSSDQQKVPITFSMLTVAVQHLDRHADVSEHAVAYLLKARETAVASERLRNNIHF